MGVPKPTNYLTDLKVQAFRGVAQPAGYQAGTRTSVNGVRGYEPLMESPRSDVNINVLIEPCGVRKPVIAVFNQVRQKPGLTRTNSG